MSDLKQPKFTVKTDYNDEQIIQTVESPYGEVIRQVVNLQDEQFVKAIEALGFYKKDPDTITIPRDVLERMRKPTDNPGRALSTMGWNTLLDKLLKGEW